MWFDFGRQEGFPTQYPPNETPVTVDVLEAGFFATYIILILTFFLAIPTTSLHTTLFRYLRISTFLTIGLVITVSNFGQEWEVGHIISRTPYKAGSAAEINALIGIKIGLRSVNVTLKSPTPPELENEIINYNERFEWTWDQGRLGFGPYSGHLQQEFRAAQYRGLPTPILWIVDYFVIDGEGFRFGRFYRTAGWYSHIALWSAFACWILAVILFRTVIVYGAYCLGTAGVLQLVTNLLWWVIRNPNSLRIPFEDATIIPKFGVNFWLNFVNGIVCITIAIVVIIFDLKWSDTLYLFFGVDPLNSFDAVVYLTKEEQQQLRNKNKKIVDVPLVEMSAQMTTDDVEYDPVYIKRASRFMGPPVLRTNKPKMHTPN